MPSVPLQPLVHTNLIGCPPPVEPQPKKRLKSSDERSLELMSLGRASFVSKSGIANLLNTVKKEGLPATYDRSAQFRARKQVCQTVTPYGKLVVTIPVVFPDGKEGDIACRKPFGIPVLQLPEVCTLC